MIGPSIIQVVVGRDDLPFSEHLYAPVFGFAGA